MSKKLIFLIAFIFTFFSIIFMAVFGTLPESTQLPDIDEFIFDIEYEEITSIVNGEEVINKAFFLTKGEYNLSNSIISIKFKVFPDNAYIEKLNVAVSISGLTVQIDLLNKVINIYVVDISAIDKSFTLTVHDQKTGDNYILYLIYKVNGDDPIVIDDF